MEKKDITYYTSFFFLINVCIGVYVNKLLYAILFLFLFITSILCRTYKNDYTHLADKLAIYLVILYGAYMLLYINAPLYIYVFIISTFLLTIFLWHYGYYTRQFCFDTDMKVSFKYHGILHLASSIGHMLIMLH